jgi:hypothetical protein
VYLFFLLETSTDKIKGNILELDGMSKDNVDDDGAEEEEEDVDGEDSELILK